MNEKDLDLHLRRVHRGGGKAAHLRRLALRYLLMVAVSAVMVGPFLWLVYLSVRTAGNIYNMPSSISELSLRAYAEVWTDTGVGRAFANSVLIAVVQVIATVLVASLAAYPLARLDFYGRDIVFLLILATLMMPFQIYLIPLFLLVSRTMGLGNSVAGVVLPFVASVFGIYLIRQFYKTVPRDMEEAARVDGAGELRVWWQIMFPLTKPAVATLAVYTFVGTWSSFLWPLIVLQDEPRQTLPVVLAKLTGTYMERQSLYAAGCVIAILPVILFFLLLQRWFLGGMTIGAVKG